MGVKPLNKVDIAMLSCDVQESFLWIHRGALREALGAFANLTAGRVNIILVDSFLDCRSILPARRLKDLGTESLHLFLLCARFLFRSLPRGLSFSLLRGSFGTLPLLRLTSL